MEQEGSAAAVATTQTLPNSPISPFLSTPLPYRGPFSNLVDDELPYEPLTKRSSVNSTASSPLKYLFELPDQCVEGNLEVRLDVDRLLSPAAPDPSQRSTQALSSQGLKAHRQGHNTTLQRLQIEDSLWAGRPYTPSAIRPTPPGSPLGMAVNSRKSSLTRTDTHMVASRESITVENVGTYLIGNVIGRGQFGTVHRAINTSTGSIVAVKRIPIDDKSREHLSAMMHEVNLLKELSSPHIVKYEGCLMSETCFSIIIEYVENGSLLHSIRTFGPFNETLCASYTAKIIDGLVYLHSKDVVHCDIKCANVLSTKSGDVKLSDFGISLNLSGQSTIRGEVNGTPNWLAPEVISLRGISKASDIWSLGCTILEMITGRPPYNGQNAMSTMYSIVEDDCPPLPEFLSEELRELLCACFNKEPRHRPTASDLRDHKWLICHGHGKHEPKVSSALSRQDSRSDATHLNVLVCDSSYKEGHRIDTGFQSASHATPDPLAEKSSSHDGTSSKHSKSLLRSTARPAANHEIVRLRAVINVHSQTHAKCQHEILCTLCKVLIKRGAASTRCKNCHLIAHSRCFTNIPVVCPTREVGSILPLQDTYLYSAEPGATGRLADHASSNLEIHNVLRRARSVAQRPRIQTSKCHPIILRKKHTKEIVVNSGDCVVM